MSKKSDKAVNVVIFLLLIILMWFIFFYRNSDGKYIEPYDNIVDYAIEAYLQFEKYFSLNVDEMTEEKFQEVYAAVLLDHPEIFWMNSYQIIVKPFSNNINTNKKVKLLYYYNEEEAKEVKSRIEPKYSAIINEAEKLDSDYKKVLYVHDELIKSAQYTDYPKENRREFQSIISIFDKGEAVCAGYSYGFKLIMDNLGIDTVSVRDIDNIDSEDNHIWNVVKLYDKWYNIDVTWDRYPNEKGVVIYNYFLKSNEEFYKDHKVQKNMPENTDE